MPYSNDSISGASVDELRQALDWNRALMEHYDEIADYNGYQKAEEKVRQLEFEMRTRRTSL